MQSMERQLGVEPADDGRVALRDVDVVVQELLAQDPGRGGMPPLDSFLGGELKLPIVISFDGTGKGALSLNTIAVNNPYMTRSTAHLRPFGLGLCGDDREGTRSVLGPNLARINDMIASARAGLCKPCNGGRFTPEVFVVTDVAALRHCEHLAGSGWCGCSQDFALRQTPQKPTTVADMYALLQQCRCPTVVERFVKSHTPLPGEELPRPCTAPGCTFAHNRATAA